MTAGIFVVVIAMAFESVGVSTAMPAAAADLNGLTLYAWAFSLFVIGQLTSSVVTGRIADRLGPVRPALVGLAVFLVGLLVAGTATSMPVLLAGRFVQGVGVGAANLALSVVIALAYPEDERPHVMTWISTAWVLPSLAGPPVAAWITETFSWHVVFLVIVPLVVLAGVVVVPRLVRLAPVLSGQHGDPAVPVPVWCGFAVAGGAVLIQFAGQRYSDGARSLVEIAMVALAVTVLILALPQMMPEGFLRARRGLASVVLSRTINAGAYLGLCAFVPLMFVETRGLSLLVAGGMVSVASVGWTTGAWLQARPWLALQRHQMIIVGQFAVFFGCVAMTFGALLPALPLWLVALLWLPSGLGMGLSIASTGLAVMSLSPSSAQGRNTASLQVGEALGNSVIVGVAGTIFASLHGVQANPVTFATVMAAMAAFALLGALAGTRIGPIRTRD